MSWLLTSFCLDKQASTLTTKLNFFSSVFYITRSTGSIICCYYQVDYIFFLFIQQTLYGKKYTSKSLCRKEETKKIYYLNSWSKVLVICPLEMYGFFLHWCYLCLLIPLCPTPPTCPVFPPTYLTSLSSPSYLNVSLFNSCESPERNHMYSC